jgi:hypothetical protein
VNKFFSNGEGMKHVSMRKILSSQKGMGMLGGILVVNVALLAAGFASLMMSEKSFKDATDAKKMALANEANKNALVLAKRLIGSSYLNRDSGTGAWSLGSGASSTNPLWQFAPSSKKLTIKNCDPRTRKPLDTLSGAPLETSCSSFSTVANFKEVVSNVKQKIQVKTTITDKISASLLGLVNMEQAQCVPGLKSGTITFEEFAEGAVVDAAFNNQLAADYGVRFIFFNSDTPPETLKIARIAKKYDTPVAFEAWASILCKEPPNRNRICDEDLIAGAMGLSAPKNGRRALSASNAMNTRSLDFMVVYEKPVESVSFDMLDLDGGETWNTYLFKDNLGAVPLVAPRISSKGYGALGGATGNNNITTYSVTSNSGKFRAIRMMGTKGIKIFGFGLDNFNTGLTRCE